MFCPYCNAAIPDEVQAEIENIAYHCSSACDMAMKVNAACIQCGKVFWSQWVETPYKWEFQSTAMFISAKDTEYEEWRNATPCKYGEFEFEVVDGKIHIYNSSDKAPFEITADLTKWQTN